MIVVDAPPPDGSGDWEPGPRPDGDLPVRVHDRVVKDVRDGRQVFCTAGNDDEGLVASR
jgi:hypothetical protein